MSLELWRVDSEIWEIATWRQRLGIWQAVERMPVPGAAALQGKAVHGGFIAPPQS